MILINTVEFCKYIFLTLLLKTFFSSFLYHKYVLSHSDVSNSLRPPGLYPARFLCPGDCSGKNPGVGGHAFLQGSSQLRDRTQGSCIAGRFFTVGATRAALYHKYTVYNNI